MIITERTLDNIDTQILQRIADGESYKSICAQLGITQRQVDNKLYIMRRYYKCNSTTHLVTKMIRLGKIELV